jgi:16S rRNA A1518/A1519 N6-dimethyltransferase RsmA/KsgA/DIM1 with predicted DNA glycosylase/AP lyase activity
MFDLVLFILFIFIVLSTTVSIIYSTLRFGISPMPSSNKAYSAMLVLVNKTGTGPIIDFGSGWGNLVIRIAKQYPHRAVIGYELSLLPWLTSVVLKKIFSLNNITLHRKDFYSAHLPAESVIVCYLFPEAMKKISDKLREEKPQVSSLISNNFALPYWQPSQVIRLDDFYKSPIYLYRVC